MNYDDWPIESIALNRIFLDTDNIRLDLAGQITQELLMADLFNNEQAMELVHSIVRNGIFPDELPVVVRRNSDCLVIEGNRRIAALKAIMDAQKAPKYYTDRIGKLAPLPRIQRVKVVIAPSRSAVQKLIASKHTKNTRRPWKPLRQAYFYKTLLDSPKGEWTVEKIQNAFSVPDISDFIRMLEMHKVAKSLQYRTDELEARVHDERNFPITTLERCYNNLKVQRLLGFRFEADGMLKISADKSNFSEAFKRIVQDIAMGNEDSRSLNSEEKIEAYVQSIVDKPFAPVDTVTTTKSFHERKGVQKSIPTVRSIRKPKGLIPSHVAFRLQSSALRNIYEELRTLPVKDYPNAAHDLLRSFLECSLVEFLKQKGEYDSVRCKERRFGPKLRELLEYAMHNIVTDRSVQKALQEVLTQSSKPYSLARMNSANHSEIHASSETDVRAAWAKIEKFMMLILNPADHYDK